MSRSAKSPWTERALGIPIAMMLHACGGGSSTSVPPSAQVERAVQQSDVEIARLLYTDSARTPPGFYTEPPSATSYAATFHIKNSDLVPPAGPSAPRFEMCTDDWNEALAWSETVALSAPVYSDLAATDMTEHYYQFVRTPRSLTIGTQQMRVYRCAFLDRTGADLARMVGVAGRINKRPIAPTDLQWTLEYLWHFSVYNNADNVVLRSAVLPGSSSPTHELTLAQLTRGAGSNGCDSIRVFAWSYRVASTSGELMSELRDLWSFDARNDSGSAQLCPH